MHLLVVFGCIDNSLEGKNKRYIHRRGIEWREEYWLINFIFCTLEAQKIEGSGSV